ncbi:MAG: hypothetical protein LBR86_09745 [Tannerella sp.]|nr:hypothetical protein [Tannerella sp.]
MMKSKILVAVAACAGLLALFACSQKSSKTDSGKRSISGVWIVDEGGSYFRDIVGSVQFEGEVQAKPLTNSTNQVMFASSSDKALGLNFLTFDVVTFLVPTSSGALVIICEIMSELNYELGNDRFILRYNDKEVLSARYELGEKFILFLDSGKKIVFHKSTS